METVCCDLCGSSSYSTVATQTDALHKTTKDFFSIVKCGDCGLHYTNPRPSPTEIGNFYSKSYSYHSSGGLVALIKREILGPWIRTIANSPLAYVFSLIPPLSNLLGSKVGPKLKDPVLRYLQQRKVENFLDIGCGSGMKAHFWGSGSSLVKLKKCIEVFGCEPDTFSRDQLNKSGIFCWSKIEEIEKDKKFDLIRMNWSLEHVHSPSEYFEFIYNHLSPGGRAVIAVPNIKGLIYHLSSSCAELPIHLYHFSEESLMSYSKKYNLEITNTLTFSYPSMFYHSSDISLLSKKFSFSRGIIFSKSFQRILNTFDIAGMGNDIVVTMKKKNSD